MPNPSEKTLEGGRFETLFNLADRVDRSAARSVDVEGELQHFNRVLENLVITEETIGDTNMDLLATILSGIVVSTEVQIDDAIRQMDNVAADLRRAIASCRVGSSDETSQESQGSPARRGPRRKRARKDVDKLRETTTEELIGMFVDNTPSFDRNLLREVDPLLPEPENPSFGDISVEETLSMMMRKSLFTEPNEDPNMEDAVPTEKPDRADPTGENFEMVAPEVEKDITVAETVVATENVTVENVANIDNPPCEMTSAPLDVPPAIEQAMQDALPQQEVAEGAAGPIPEQSNRGKRPKKGKKKRSEPRLDMPIPAPHLSYQEVDQSELIEAEMWYLADKLAQSVREVTEATTVVVDTIPEVDPSRVVNPEKSLEEQELVRQNTSAGANTLVAPTVGHRNSLPTQLVTPITLEKTIPIPPVPESDDLVELLTKIEHMLDGELIEYGKIAKVDLVDFLIQLLRGPRSFYDYFPTDKTSRRQAAAAFQLVLGMVEAGLILIFQEDVIKKTPIIISLEDRPEFNPVLSLLHRVANFA